MAHSLISRNEVAAVASEKTALLEKIDRGLEKIDPESEGAEDMRARVEAKRRRIQLVSDCHGVELEMCDFEGAAKEEMALMRRHYAAMNACGDEAASQADEPAPVPVTISPHITLEFLEFCRTETGHAFCCHDGSGRRGLRAAYDADTGVKTLGVAAVA